MANPYDRPSSSSAVPASPPAVRPPWFRRGRVWGLLAVGFLFGGCAGAVAVAGQDTRDRTPVRAAGQVTPRATVTVTAPPVKAARPAPTVTVTETARVTVTAAPPPADDPAPGGSGGAEDSGSSDAGSADAQYANCAAVRAAGAAPIHAGDPGYGRHLDRDGDGVGCES
ncbi:excalibur calcium-binding domain-containing protein [Streptomyces paromomycinus]|uniref:Calcium-binding protein n=1 Tax=Streptomyces paromomycinus TaxID=92743 RepID=A0A401W1X3_STREY|nr:excalibur calcium-binding domain-containing protein [Streptomyces paromomycinus]GCD43285.1 calcium-binding protein [Streptomyces paromomycinus]